MTAMTILKIFLTKKMGRWPHLANELTEYIHAVIDSYMVRWMGVEEAGSPDWLTITDPFFILSLAPVQLAMSTY